MIFLPPFDLCCCFEGRSNFFLRAWLCGIHSCTDAWEKFYHVTMRFTLFLHSWLSKKRVWNFSLQHSFHINQWTNWMTNSAGFKMRLRKNSFRKSVKKIKIIWCFILQADMGKYCKSCSIQWRNICEIWVELSCVSTWKKLWFWNWFFWCNF